MRYLIIIFFSLLGLPLLYSQSDSLYLRLPDYIYTTTASKFSIYYKNIIQTKEFQNFSFSVDCPVGYDEEVKYNLDSLEAGIYPFSLDVKDSLGNILESDESQLIVTENNTFHDDTLNVLCIGDSYTNSAVYVKTIKDIYDDSCYYPMRLLGTNYNSVNPYYGLDNSIYHEGYSGRTWHWFSNYVENPFIYTIEEGLNFKKYFEEDMDGHYPEIISIFLGINDIGLADATSVESIDEWIDEKIITETRMVKFIDSLSNSLPDTKIGIVLTPPVNERYYTYADSMDGWWARKKQHHRLVQRYIDYFNDYGNSNISVIPVYLNIDTFIHFGETDAIHPKISGYEAIGETVYGWLNYQVSEMLNIATIKNLTITVNRFSVDISWDYPINGVMYNIYRSTDPYDDFVLIGTTLNLYFTDTNISQSNKYFYKITAENSLK